MKKNLLVGIVAAALQVAPVFPAVAQQTPAQQARPGSLDIASIRRQAAQLAEVRAALADPDPNLRLLAIREIARTGDPMQRQLAIETGLSSAESALQEVAIRAMMVNVQQMVFAMSDAEGKPITQGVNSLVLSVTKFDPDTGKIQGDRWNGQFQGAVFNFALYNGSNVNGRLAWNPEQGEFRGMINMVEGRPDYDRRASWRPR